MQCPRDQQDLVKQQYGEVEFEACPLCGGIWLCREEFEDALCIGAGHALSGDGFTPSARRDPIPCPFDPDHNMVQLVFYGIQIDTCPEHNGIWFDSGELARLTGMWRKLLHQGMAPKAIAETIFKQKDPPPETLIDRVCEGFARFMGSMAETYAHTRGIRF